MSHDSSETDRNVTAFFGSRDAAERAVAHLVETGLPRDRILLRTGAARKPATVEDGKGLLQEVKELILPSEKPDAAVEALKHEGFLLSARPDPDAHDTVFRLLEADGGQGVESREDIWPDWKSGSTPPADDVDSGPELASESAATQPLDSASTTETDGSEPDPGIEPATPPRDSERTRPG